MDLTRLRNKTDKTLVPELIMEVGPESTDGYKHIYDLYQSEDRIENYMALLMNVIITSNKPVFMMSRNILLELSRNDGNHKFTGDIVRPYPRAIKNLIDEKFIECLYEPSKVGKGQRVAGLYRVIDLQCRAKMVTNIGDINDLENKLHDEYVNYQGLTKVVTLGKLDEEN